MKELIKIQAELKAPKNLKNTFGGFMYRSAEDILEAVKPFLNALNCTLTLSDEIVVLGEHTPTKFIEMLYDSKSKAWKQAEAVTGCQRFYVKATATIENEAGEIIKVAGYAREEEEKKGMDAAQITGSASSYARKYALNGLFLIDDTKDPDHPIPSEKTPKKLIPEKTFDESILKQVELASTVEELQLIWETYPQYYTVKLFKDEVKKRKKELTGK